MFLAKTISKKQGVNMLDTKRITKLAAVAALYVVLTIAIHPFSYGPIQFRISEFLVLLAFYRRDYSIALIIGCAIANFFSPMLLYDVLFGTTATALAVFFVARSKNIYIASLYPVLFNGIIIGLELNYVLQLPLIESMIYVALGELAVVSVIGVILFKTLEKNKGFLELIDANQNI